MSISGIKSYIFGKGTDTPTYEDVKAKRALQEQLMSSLSTNTPQNIGQGIHAVGKAIGARRAGNAATEGETGFRNQANESMSALQQLMMGGMGGGMSGTASTMGATGTPPFMPQGGTGQPALNENQQLGNAAMAAIGQPENSPAPASAPEGWDQIRNGIFQGESGGDYNALFGYSNRPGGQFSNVRLTDMSVNDALDFSKPSGQYGQTVKGQIGRVATPMGAYQVVGTTLRAAKDGLGLTGDEQMTPELQDEVGQWIYANQGTNAWEGYAGPRDQAPTGGGMNGTVSTQGAPGQSQGYNPEGAAMATKILDNPYATEGQKALAGLMMQRMMQAPPTQMDQISLQKAQIELQNLQNPQADQTSAMQEYEYARNQGFDGSFMEYQTAKAAAGRTQINNNVNTGDTAPGIGKLSTDYGYVLDPATGQPRIDPATGLPTAAPVPGSLAAQNILDEAAASQVGQDNKNRSGSIVTQDIDRALGIIEQSPAWTTGLGARLQAVPGTQAKSLSGLLQTIKANVGFDRLQQMRDASVTGGALGAINETEMALLQSVLGNLDQSLDAEDLARNLERVNMVYLEIINGPGDQQVTTPPAQTAPPPPQGTSLTPDEWSRAWSAMPPEDRALFQ